MPGARHIWTREEDQILLMSAQQGMVASRICFNLGWPNTTCYLKRVRVRANLIGAQIQSAGYQKKGGVSDEIFIEAIKKSDGWASAMAFFSITPSGGAYSWAKKTAERLKVETSHFIGSGHGRAVKKGQKESIIKKHFRLWTKKEAPKRPACSHLRRKAVLYGLLKEECALCKNVNWRKEKIPLDLDHKNGNPWDHRLQNLQLLCKNCHAQTDNFGGKNITKAIVAQKKMIELSLHWPYCDENDKHTCEKIARALEMSMPAVIARIKRSKKMTASGIAEIADKSLRQKMESLFVVQEKRTDGKRPPILHIKKLAVSCGVLEEKCSWCRRKNWRGFPIALDLDHINGNPWDQRKDNLRLLCRNCHAQTKTFGAKNIPKVRDRQAKIEALDVRWGECDSRDIVFCQDLAEKLGMKTEAVRAKIREVRRSQGKRVAKTFAFSVQKD